MLCIVDLFVIIYKKLMQLLITTTVNHLDKGSRTEKFTAVNVGIITLRELMRI
jgi:hypothetical protein